MFSYFPDTNNTKGSIKMGKKVSSIKSKKKKPKKNKSLNNQDLLDFINNPKNSNKNLDLWDIITYTRGSQASDNIRKKYHTVKSKILAKYDKQLGFHKNRIEFIDFYIDTLITSIADEDKKTDSLCSAIDIALGVYQDGADTITNEKNKTNSLYKKLTNLRKKTVNNRKIIEDEESKNITWDRNVENKVKYFTACLDNYKEILNNSGLSKDEQKNKYNETLKYLDDWKVLVLSKGENYFQTNFSFDKKIKNKTIGGKNKMKDIFKYGLVAIGSGAVSILAFLGIGGELGKTGLEKAVERDQPVLINENGQKKYNFNPNSSYDLGVTMIYKDALKVVNENEVTLDFYVGDNFKSYRFFSNLTSITTSSIIENKEETAFDVASQYFQYILGKIDSDNNLPYPDVFNDYLEAIGKESDKSISGKTYCNNELTLQKLKKFKDKNK
jgi:hypothetical protein